MKPADKRKTVAFRHSVLIMFFIVVSLTAGLALGLQYYFSYDMAMAAAQRTFLRTSEQVEDRIQSLDRQSAALATELGQFHELETFPDRESEQRALPVIAGMMEQSPSLFAIYVGYDNGDYFELINLESDENLRVALKAAVHDRWVVVKITGKGASRTREYVYLNEKLNPRASRKMPTNYDPRGRPWFMQARRHFGIVKTAPYLFYNVNIPGVTYAKAMDGGQRVIAVDITRTDMSRFLAQQQLMPGSEAFVFDRQGDVTAQTVRQERTDKPSNDHLTLSAKEQAFVNDNPVIRASNEMDWPPFDFAMNGKPKGYSIDMLNMLASRAGMKVEYVNGYDWVGLLKVFKKGEVDLLQSVVGDGEREKMGILSSAYAPMPQVFVYRKGEAAPTFASLVGKTVAMPRGWGMETYMKQHHPGIHLLSVRTTLEAMRAVLNGEAKATLDSEPVLRYLASAYFLRDLAFSGEIREINRAKISGLHFLVRPEKPELASILNKALATLTPEDKARLEQKWLASKKTASGDAPVVMGTVPHPELLRLSREVKNEGAMRTMEIKGENYFGYVARLRSIYGANEFVGFLVPVKHTLKPYMDMLWFSLMLTSGVFLLLIPAVWYCATRIIKPINALARENEKVKERRYKEVSPVHSNITEIAELSDSMTSMATAIEAHESSLRDLMDAFVKLIATAIDQKSPYTSRHCERVPALSEMLARAASDSSEGPFAEFTLATDDEWREFRTASWMHDCGKVTTPEHVVDKATKLEMIYNRIHEIRMRFEVLLRDAEIEFWQGRTEGKDLEMLQEILDAKRIALQESFTFIAECNVGGEFMSEDKIEKVKEIARNTWMRHFDNRLGLSQMEMTQHHGEGQALPCEEPLLADRHEHLVERPDDSAFDNEDGHFAMQPPQYLYNHGEIYNLCISRGTLTAEERYKVNEHVVATIRMLETLPYPQNMARIAEYAGAHHETLIGTGYPRKLEARDISIPARIMALADVFEAVTASDRPYRKANKLSEAIDILATMVKDQHLDADLFKLFLESGVYLDYAHEFLESAQIDDVDVTAYVSALDRAPENPD